MMRNLTLSIPLALLMFLPACTVAPGQNTLETELHPPLLYPQWGTKNYTTRSGIHVCAVSSGYNGLTVTVGQMQGGLDMVVESTRIMQPGATFTINSSGKTFQTYETFFPPSSTQALVDALSKGGKGYLEWSEFSGPSGRERSHVQNIVQLDDFSARLKECQASLGRRALPN